MGIPVPGPAGPLRPTSKPSDRTNWCSNARIPPLVWMHYPPRITTQGWLPEFVTTSLGVPKDRHGAPELQRP